MRSFFTLGLFAFLAIGCATNPPHPPAAETAPEAETSAPAVEAEPETETSMPAAGEAPAEVAQAEPAVLRTGMFVDGEHPTQGTAQIIEQGGDRRLELGDDFQTDPGPDLVVVLHRSADVLGASTPPAFPINEGDYIVLEPLQNVVGNQQYPIPADIDLDDYQSAAIWCRQFNATFGAAPLQN
jgi:hypothetical protein